MILCLLFLGEEDKGALAPSLLLSWRWFDQYPYQFAQTNNQKDDNNK